MDLLHPAWATRWRSQRPRAERRRAAAANESRWQRYADPWRFYELALRPVPALLCAAAALSAIGLWAAWGPAVADASARDAERLLALHLPLAWLALALAGAMLAAVLAGRLTRAVLPSLLIEALAPTGASAAVLAVATGAMWQQASGGTQAPWDMPVPAGVWPWTGAALAQALALVLLRVRLVTVERARRGLDLGDEP